MPLIIVKTKNSKKAKSFYTKISTQLKKPTHLLMNPIKGTVMGFVNSDNFITVLKIKIQAFPVYWVVLMAGAVHALYRNIFTLVLTLVLALFCVPFTSIFWSALYYYGLRKHGFKGKIKILTPSKAWGEYIGAD